MLRIYKENKFIFINRCYPPVVIPAACLINININVPKI